MALSGGAQDSTGGLAQRKPRSGPLQPKPKGLARLPGQMWEDAQTFARDYTKAADWILEKARNSLTSAHEIMDPDEPTISARGATWQSERTEQVRSLGQQAATTLALTPWELPAAAASIKPAYQAYAGARSEGPIAGLKAAGQAFGDSYTGTMGKLPGGQGALALREESMARNEAAGVPFAAEFVTDMAVPFPGFPLRAARGAGGMSRVELSAQRRLRRGGELARRDEPWRQRETAELDIMGLSDEMDAAVEAGDMTRAQEIGDQLGLRREDWQQIGLETPEGHAASAENLMRRAEDQELGVDTDTMLGSDEALEPVGGLAENPRTTERQAFQEGQPLRSGPLARTEGQIAIDDEVARRAAVQPEGVEAGQVPLSREMVVDFDDPAIHDRIRRMEGRIEREAAEAARVEEAQRGMSPERRDEINRSWEGDPREREILDLSRQMQEQLAADDAVGAAAAERRIRQIRDEIDGDGRSISDLSSEIEGEREARAAAFDDSPLNDSMVRDLDAALAAGETERAADIERELLRLRAGERPPESPLQHWSEDVREVVPGDADHTPNHEPAIRQAYSEELRVSDLASLTDEERGHLHNLRSTSEAPDSQERITQGLWGAAAEGNQPRARALAHALAGDDETEAITRAVWEALETDRSTAARESIDTMERWVGADRLTRWRREAGMSPRHELSLTAEEVELSRVSRMQAPEDAASVAVATHELEIRLGAAAHSEDTVHMQALARSMTDDPSEWNDVLVEGITRELNEGNHLAAETMGRELNWDSSDWDDVGWEMHDIEAAASEQRQARMREAGDERAANQERYNQQSREEDRWQEEYESNQEDASREHYQEWGTRRASRETMEPQERVDSIQAEIEDLAMDDYLESEAEWMRDGELADAEQVLEEHLRDRVTQEWDNFTESLRSGNWDEAERIWMEDRWEAVTDAPGYGHPDDANHQQEWLSSLVEEIDEEDLPSYFDMVYERYGPSERLDLLAFEINGSTTDEFATFRGVPPDQVATRSGMRRAREGREATAAGYLRGQPEDVPHGTPLRDVRRPEPEAEGGSPWSNLSEDQVNAQQRDSLLEHFARAREDNEAKQATRDAIRRKRGDADDVTSSILIGAGLGGLAASDDEPGQGALAGIGILGAIRGRPRFRPTAVDFRKKGKFASIPDEEIADIIMKTDDARLDEKGLTLKMKRYQHPDQEGMPSVRGGVFYTAEPRMSSRWNDYRGHDNPMRHGGSHRRDVEKTYTKPLMVEGATGGKIPERAYNVIKDDHEAYDKLWTEMLGAFAAERGSMANVSKARVANLLHKHGVDNAEDLVSEMWGALGLEGNRLRYAVQEAIIAQAARNAGYDAIIGIGPKNRRLSEVFDLTDERYPVILMGLAGGGGALAMDAQGGLAQ